MIPPVPASGGTPPETVDEEGTDAAGPQESGQGEGVQGSLIPEPSVEVVTLARQSADRCRMLDGLPPRFRSGPYDDVHRASVPKKITFFEQGGKEDTWQEILNDTTNQLSSGSGLQRLGAETLWRQLHDGVTDATQQCVRERDEGGEAPLKTPRLSQEVPSEPGSSSLAPLVAEVKMELEKWALSSSTSVEETNRMKAMMDDFEKEAAQLERERGHRAGPDPGPRGEIYWKDMTPTEQRLTVPALIKALDIHFQYAAVEPVKLDQIVAKDTTLQSRFVIVNKKWLQRAFGPKGRLCVGGHLDPQAGEYETSSPTAQLLGHHLLLVITVAKRWRGRGGDITAAFLQGEPLPREKPLYIWFPRKLPSEVQQYLNDKLKGFRTDMVKVVKGVFGLNESPRLWYLGLRRHLVELGFREMKLAPCVFTLHIGGNLEAMATVHVDDVLVAGSQQTDAVWQELQQRLTFGSWTDMMTGFKFLGRFITQDEHSFEITTSMIEYCNDLQEVTLEKTMADDRPMTPDEVSSLRTIVGKLSWAARQGRPDVLFGVSFLQQSMKAPTIKLFKLANAIVRVLRQDLPLRFVDLGCDLSEVLLVISSDGAYGIMPEGKSQQGWLVGLAHPRIKEGAAKMNLIEWQSTACKRVVRSSMAIEASAASLAYEHGEYVRALFGEIMLDNFAIKRWGHFVRLW